MRLRTRSNRSCFFRMKFPKRLHGLKGEELSKATGIPKCVFVNELGTDACNEERDGCIQLAKIALENSGHILK